MPKNPPAAPPTLPHRTDHQPYAVALARLDQLGTQLGETRRELAGIEVEIAQRRAVKAQQSAARDRAATAERLDVIEEAHRRYRESAVLPAEGEAIRLVAIRLRATVWEPAVRNVALAVAQLYRQLAAIDRLADELTAAGLSSVAYPRPFFRVQMDAVRDMVGQGLLSRTGPELAGTDFAWELAPATPPDEHRIPGDPVPAPVAKVNVEVGATTDGFSAGGVHVRKDLLKLGRNSAASARTPRRPPSPRSRPSRSRPRPRPGPSTPQRRRPGCWARSSRG